MIGKLVGGFILAAGIMAGVMNAAAADNPKVMALSRKIIEISTLQQDIGVKIATAEKMRARLMGRMQDLKDEINRQGGKPAVQAPGTAAMNLRIDYNRKLIRQLQAYSDKLAARIAYFRRGNEILEYLLQQIGDNLQLIKTLQDFEVNALIEHIDAVLDTYIPAVKKPMINIGAT